MIETTEQSIVDATITQRHSIRAFLPTPVAREDIEAMLNVAARAPSGTNIQPWKVIVVTGTTKQTLSDEILRAYSDPALSATHTAEYHYYPQQWSSPYLERRRKVGWDLYALLNITRDDKAGMHAQHARNFVFFDAPVGLIFTIDRILEKGSWLDYGMFLQNIMIAARARGLDTCPQAAFAQYHKILTRMLHIPQSETVVCGMSLGYADHSKTACSLATERDPASHFAKFMT